jgi:hypothetical protein
VGGRVWTDEVDGFLIDRGFQLINSGYPALADLISSLHLFAAPRRVGLMDENLNELALPTSPRRIFTTLRGWPGTPNDLIALARLVRHVTATPVATLLAAPDVTIAEGLRAAGLSHEVRRDLLQPFFRGVVLDDPLDTSWRYGQLLLRSFVRGRPSLSGSGARGLALALLARCTPGSVHTATPVRSITPTSVTVDDGVVTARAVLVATDAASAALFGAPVHVRTRAQTTWWWSFSGSPRTDALVLDRRTPALTNSCAVSAIAPGYSPVDSTLVAVSALGRPSVELEAMGRASVARVHQRDVSELTLVATSDIPHALPHAAAPLQLRRSPRHGEIYFAGDYMETPSIQGALASGTHSARSVLRALQSK